MTYLKKILFSSSYIFVFSIFAALISYFIRIVLVKNLSLSEYGLFFSVLAFVSFLLQFRDLGLNPALVRYTALFNAKKEYGNIKSGVTSVFLFQTTISLLACIVMLFSADYLSIHFFKDARAKPLIYFFCVYILITYLVTLLRSYFKGSQLIKLFCFSNFLRVALIFIFINIFFYYNLGVFSPMFAYIIGWAVTFFLFLFLFFRNFDFFNHKFDNFRKVSKKLLFFGVFAIFTDFGSKIIESSDTLMLTYFKNLEIVGIYNILIPTSMIFLFFINSIADVVFPLYSALWAQKKINTIKQGLSSIFKYYIIFISPIFAVFMFYSKEALELVFNLNHDTAAVVLRILLIGVFFLSLANLNNYVIAGMGRPKFTTAIYFIAAIINIIINLILIPRFDMLGASIGTAIGYFFIFFCSYLFLRKKLNFNIEWRFYLKQSGIIILFYISLYFFDKIFNYYIIYRLSLTILISSSIYFILSVLTSKFLLKDLLSIIKK